MQKIKSYLAVCALFLGMTAFSACSTSGEAVSVDPKPAGMNAQSVVLMDPSADDAMIPSVALNLSRGAVTVYSLDQPAVTTQRAVVAPLVPAGPIITKKLGSAPVTLKRPAGAPGESDPRVTVFDLNSPVPKAVVPALPDTVIVPVSKADLQSPFDKDGRLVPAPTDKNLPFRKTVSEKQKAAPVGDVDGEQLDDIPPFSDVGTAAPASVPERASARRLPPKGMTY